MTQLSMLGGSLHDIRTMSADLCPTHTNQRIRVFNSDSVKYYLKQILHSFLMLINLFQRNLINDILLPIQSFLSRPYCFLCILHKFPSQNWRTDGITCSASF